MNGIDRAAAAIESLNSPRPPCLTVLSWGFDYIRHSTWLVFSNTCIRRLGASLTYRFHHVGPSVSTC